MLEQFKLSARELLRHFDGSCCPLCSALARQEQMAVARLAKTKSSAVPLCALHLKATSTMGKRHKELAQIVIQTLDDLCLEPGADCPICARLSLAEARMIRAIQRLDSLVRFRKALESAPPFCRKHVKHVIKAGNAENFIQVEKGKLKAMRDALAQAWLRKSAELDELTSRALALLETQSGATSLGELQDNELTEAEARAPAEFERWEAEQQLKRLGELESELASLRYRNAVLAEENRRLKLALLGRTQ